MGGEDILGPVQFIILFSCCSLGKSILPILTIAAQLYATYTL